MATIVASGGRAVSLAGNVAVTADVRAAYELARAEFGGVDIVVNNAGIAIGGPIGAFSDEDFDRLVAVNLRSVFTSGREAAQHLSDGGRIINVSALLPAAAVAMLGVYGATKAGVEALTRSLAAQLGPRGITANAVAPGPTDTDLLAPDARANMDAIVSQTPLRRFGQPVDIATVVAFLASEDAGWITGQILHADGGLA